MKCYNTYILIYIRHELLHVKSIFSYKLKLATIDVCRVKLHNCTAGRWHTALCLFTALCGSHTDTPHSYACRTGVDWRDPVLRAQESPRGCKMGWEPEDGLVGGGRAWCEQERGIHPATPGGTPVTRGRERSPSHLGRPQHASGSARFKLGLNIR